LNLQKAIFLPFQKEAVENMATIHHQHDLLFSNFRNTSGQIGAPFEFLQILTIFTL